MTALIRAAFNGRHAIVERLVVARADLNTKDKYAGCALPHSPSGGFRWSPTLPIVPAPSRRDTALHLAAYYGYTKSIVALLVGGADRTITDDDG
jgi:ankyrin repeat protein